jgi:hypothetical protein
LLKLSEADTALITACLQVRVLPAPPRTPTLPEISRFSATSAELGGFFARACLCKGVLELSGLFRGLCLCPRNSVSRKQRFQFEETRFECAAIGWQGQAFGPNSERHRSMLSLRLIPAQYVKPFRKPCLCDERLAWRLGGARSTIVTDARGRTGRRTGNESDRTNNADQ